MINIFNKFLNVLFNIFIVFVGMILILGLFYIRLLKRISRDLWENMSYFQLSVTMFSILILCISIYNILKNMGIITKNGEKLFKYFGDKFKRFVDMLKICIKQIYYISVFVFAYIPRTYFKVPSPHFSVLKYIVKSFSNPENYLFYSNILKILRTFPITLFTITFFTDVVFRNHLHQTFILIPILLLPLVEKVFIFILEDFYDTHKQYFVCVNKSRYRQRNAIYYNGFYYTFSKTYWNLGVRFKSFPDYFNNYFLLLKNLRNTLDYYEKENQGPIWDVYYLSISVIRLCSFLYILFYGIL